MEIHNVLSVAYWFINMSILKKIIAILFLTLSANLFATPIHVRVPIHINQLAPTLFTSFQITGYMVDGVTHPIVGDVLTEGGEYTTPQLDLGDRAGGEQFQFRLLGQLRARNEIPGGDDIIVPYRMRVTARVDMQTREGQVTLVEDRMESDGAGARAHHIRPRNTNGPYLPNPFINWGTLTHAFNIGFTANNVMLVPGIIGPDLISG
jgi:hypothetical protein